MVFLMSPPVWHPNHFSSLTLKLKHFEGYVKGMCGTGDMPSCCWPEEIEKCLLTAQMKMKPWKIAWHAERQIEKQFCLPGCIAP